MACKSLGVASDIDAPRSFPKGREGVLWVLSPSDGCLAWILGDVTLARSLCEQLGHLRGAEELIVSPSRCYCKRDCESDVILPHPAPPVKETIGE